MDITRIPHPAPVPSETRDQAIADPGFGKVFSDHMISIDWDERRSWHDARLEARGPLTLDPACAVLHYAQEIFEGMKAYRTADGGLAMFRPYANAARFNRSAARMAMPELPETMFVEALRELVLADADWMPSIDGGALYLRPFMIATEAFLGVRPAKEYRFCVIASPVGGYFKSGAAAVSIHVARDHVRAAPGGTGEAKTGGNYAASLVPQAEAVAAGYDQVVFLDAVERRWVEELGGMNLFFVFADGRIITPPLTGTILPGITRDSLLALMRDEGLDVREEPYALDDWRKDARSGALTETMACGTAAVVTAVGQVGDPVGGDFTIGSGGPGQLTTKMRDRLTAIQRGEAADPHGWVVRLD